MRIRVQRNNTDSHVLFFSKEKALRTILSTFSHGSTRQLVGVQTQYAYAACKYLKELGNEIVGDASTVSFIKQHEEPLFEEWSDAKRFQTQLYPFQRDGVRFLRSRKRALLADDMGLGKTVTTLLSLQTPTVIVCPKVMVSTWYDECRKWRPDLKPVIWSLPYSVFSTNNVLHITSYNQLLKLQSDIKLEPQTFGRPIPKWTGLGTGMSRPTTPFTIAFDEAHYLKNPGASRTQVCRALASLAERAYLLTGTPLLNEPPELWSILEVVGAAQAVFGHYGNFMDLFGAVKKTIYIQGEPRNVIDHWSETPSEAALKRLSCFMLRRTKEQVLPELPRKTYRDIRVEIKPKDMRELPLSKAMLDGMTDEAVLTACAEPGAIAEGRQKLAMMKLEALDALLDEYEATDTLSVVFSYHRGPIEHVAKRAGWKVITGDTSTSERGEIVKQFQAGMLKGLGGTIGAMGVGVTLTRASHEIFVDQSYTPAENLQAEDREARIGQKNAVLVTRLISNHPIDERVSAILDRKMALIQNMGLGT